MGCKYLCHAHKRSLLLQLFIKYPPSTQGVADAATQGFTLFKANMKTLLIHKYVQYTFIFLQITRRILKLFMKKHYPSKPLVLKYIIKENYGYLIP